jgi:uncharacterized LabA/DUF88 family protein
MAGSERVAIFIDGSNFYHSLKDTFGLFHEGAENVELFRKLVEFLRNGRLLVGVYYYNAPLDYSYNKALYSRQQRFFYKLRLIPGFNVILCNMRKSIGKDGKIEFRVKGDDIHLATDMLAGAYEDRYDTAVLVSGDGDFRPAILKVRKLGRLVENAYFQVSRSELLRTVCDKSVLLDGFMQDILNKKDK